MPQKSSKLNRVFIALGSNLGDRLLYLQQALDKIDKRLGPIVRCSSLYESAAWGDRDQQDFYNAMCEIHTEITPLNLLGELQSMEKELGKSKTRIWGPRTLDLDIIYYGQKIIVEKDLIIPHPNMYLRNFVLQPLAEIAPEFIHPLMKKKTKSLLRECPDQTNIDRISTLWSTNDGLNR
jgi:2-amino-4-hydroxy-6-hydroxymethyldihydropteridine diphosphokinase